MYRLIVAGFRLQMTIDRTGEVDVRRCSIADLPTTTPEDRVLPALPDIELFTFSGDNITIKRDVTYERSLANLNELARPKTGFV